MQSFKEFRLLEEKDNRHKIIKFLSKNVRLEEDGAKKIADIAHNLSDKHSIILANVLASYYNEVYHQALVNNLPKPEDSSIITTPEYQEKIKEQAYELFTSRLVGNVLRTLERFVEIYKLPEKPLPNVDFKQMNMRNLQTYVRSFNHIERWLQNSGEFESGMKMAEATKLADKWYESRDEGKEIEIKEGQTILTDVFDGEQTIDINGVKHFWVNLNSTSCGDEGDSMRHCAAAEIGTLYSLRTTAGVPKLTADIAPHDNTAGQIYARANTKPKAKYHKAILYLLGYYDVEKVIPRNYNEESFTPDDLSDEDMEWYEEKFGVELTTGGVTEKQLEEVEALFDDWNEDTKANVSIYCDFSSEYLNPNITIWFNFDEFFDLVPFSNKNDEVYHDIFSYDVDSEDNLFFDDNELDGFDVENGTGDVLDWARSIIGDADYWARNYENDWRDKLKQLIKAELIESPPSEMLLSKIAVGSGKDDDRKGWLISDGDSVDSRPEYLTKIKHGSVTMKHSGTTPVNLIEFPIQINRENVELISRGVKPLKMKKPETDNKWGPEFRPWNAANSNRLRLKQIQYSKLLALINKKFNVNEWLKGSKAPHDPNQLELDLKYEAKDYKTILSSKQGWHFTNTSERFSDSISLVKYSELGDEQDAKDFVKIERNFKTLQEIVNNVIYRYAHGRFTKVP